MLASAIKNIMPANRLLPVTRIVDHLMELKAGTSEHDTYRYLDPKQAITDEALVPRVRNPFRNAVVFVVGGGNYVEFQVRPWVSWSWVVVG